MPRTARIRRSRSRIRSSPVSRQNNHFQNETVQQNINLQQDSSNDDLPLTSPRLMRSDGNKRRRKRRTIKRQKNNKLTRIYPFIFTN
jgi:hypothetical protein